MCGRVVVNAPERDLVAGLDAERFEELVAALPMKVPARDVEDGPTHAQAKRGRLLE